jgi:hypothetical protein
LDACEAQPSDDSTRFDDDEVANPSSSPLLYPRHQSLSMDDDVAIEDKYLFSGMLADYQLKRHGNSFQLMALGF